MADMANNQQVLRQKRVEDYRLELQIVGELVIAIKRREPGLSTLEVARDLKKDPGTIGRKLSKLAKRNWVKKTKYHTWIPRVLGLVNVLLEDYLEENEEPDLKHLPNLLAVLYRRIDPSAMQHEPITA